MNHQDAWISLAGHRLVLGITGGIAAYKSAQLTRLLVKEKAAVDVVMTAAAEQFVGPATFHALSRRPVWGEQVFQHPERAAMAHIDLTRGALACLVAPASADFLARLAQGMADDLLTTTCLARDCPLLVAPAMNRQMWESPATQRNMETLRRDGVVILGPAQGEQACGEIGSGRMLEAEDILEDLLAWLQPKPLQDVNVLMTAGATYEVIDPVRGITNLSSGKQGFALARALREMGAQVTLIAGSTHCATPRGVRRVNALSAEQMHAAVIQNIAQQDIFIAVAAVADYRAEQGCTEKIKKKNAPLTLTLVPNPDILADVASRHPHIFCVGFAAETQNMEAYALQKMESKNLRLVVGNRVSDALGTDSNTVILFDSEGRHPIANADKLTVARSICRHLARLWQK